MARAGECIARLALAVAPHSRKVLVFAKPYRAYLLALVLMGALVAVFDVSFPLITGSLIDHLQRHEQSPAANPRIAGVRSDQSDYGRDPRPWRRWSKRRRNSAPEWH